MTAKAKVDILPVYENHPVYLQFMRDILTDPEDSAVRLILADWIEDQGDEARAYDIRRQVANPNLVHCCQGDAETGLLCPGRDGDVWCPNCEWLLDRGVHTALLGEGATGKPKYEVRRGFLHTVRCRLNDWLKRGPGVMGRHPVERAEALGKKPHEYHLHPKRGGGGVIWYAWFRGRHEDSGMDACSLPEAVWDEVSTHSGCQVHGGWADFLHEETAIDALSETMIGVVSGRKG